MELHQILQRFASRFVEVDMLARINATLSCGQ